MAYSRNYYKGSYSNNNYSRSSYSPRSSAAPDVTPIVSEDLQEVLDLAVKTADTNARKFEDNDLYTEPLFLVLAEEYVKNYAGDFDYMVDLSVKYRQAQRRNETLSVGQWRGALNCAVAGERRRLNAMGITQPKASTETKGMRRPDTLPAFLHNGYYTIVLPNGVNVTLRIKMLDEEHRLRYNKQEGDSIVSFLYGPHNTSDYKGIGYLLQGRQVVFFKDFAADQTYKNQRDALAVLLGCADATEFGKAYALESVKCYMCGRDLTKEESITTGLGSTCAKKGY